LERRLLQAGFGLDTYTPDYYKHAERHIMAQVFVRVKRREDGRSGPGGRSATNGAGCI